MAEQPYKQLSEQELTHLLGLDVENDANQVENLTVPVTSLDQIPEGALVRIEKVEEAPNAAEAADSVIGSESESRPALRFTTGNYGRVTSINKQGDDRIVHVRTGGRGSNIYESALKAGKIRVYTLET